MTSFVVRDYGGSIMKFIKYVVALLLSLPVLGQADSLFGSDLAGDRKLPKIFGIGVDYFSLDQPFQIDRLSISTLVPILPPNLDPALIGTDSEVTHGDLKIDVWLLPFLNVFAIYGQIDGETIVDLSNIGVPLPPEVSRLAIDYDGDVYGGGLVLVVGGDRWFASVTGTFTETSLSGDFNSSVQATTIQPRVGLRFGDESEFWIGGYFIDAEESHAGTAILDLGPLIGVVPIDFDVKLSQKQDFSLSFGTHMMLSHSWEATIEVGAGDRDTAPANLTYRFE